MDSISDDSVLTKPTYQNGVYGNPWDCYQWPSFKRIFSFLWKLHITSEKIPSKQILDERLPVERPDFNKLSNPPTSGIQTTWFGHATVLVQFDGISILTDPVFSERCSPFSWIGGNRRYRPVPCEVEELPKVDIVLISHSHYDHLDYSSVQKLNAKFGDSLHWFVPVGLKSWMISTGCQKVTELSWWKEVKLEKNLWGSWLVKGQNNTFFFAGDTGYCEEFKKIGKKYGPITLAAIPIGAYDPRDFLRHHHVSPEEAVQIQTDVQAKYSLGIHWGTFRMAIEPYDECVGRVTQAIRERKLQPGSFFTLIHGHMATVGEIIIMRCMTEIHT